MAEKTLVDAQVGRWLKHCREAGHTPATEGGTALFDRTFGWTYIACCECEWSFEDTEAKAALAS